VSDPRNEKPRIKAGSASAWLPVYGPHLLLGAHHLAGTLQVGEG